MSNDSASDGDKQTSGVHPARTGEYPPPQTTLAGSLLWRNGRRIAINIILDSGTFLSPGGTGRIEPADEALPTNPKGSETIEIDGSQHDVRLTDMSRGGFWVFEVQEVYGAEQSE